MLVFWWLGAAAMLLGPATRAYTTCIKASCHRERLAAGNSSGADHCPGIFQPVEIKAPPGALISLAVDNQFDQSRPGPRKAGMSDRRRLSAASDQHPPGRRAGSLSHHRGDRPPLPAAGPGMPLRHPRSNITEEDLKLALDGKFVTRVIYLEDPRHALPARDNPQVAELVRGGAGPRPAGRGRRSGTPRGHPAPRGKAARSGRRSVFFFGSPPFVDCSAGAGRRAKEPPPKRTGQLPQTRDATDAERDRPRAEGRQICRRLRARRLPTRSGSGEADRREGWR